MIYDITINGDLNRVEIDRPEGRWRCRLNGLELEVDAVLVQPDMLSIRFGKRVHEVRIERSAGETNLWMGGSRFAAEVRDPRSLRGRIRAASDAGPRKLLASMPGKVVRVLVQEGSEVEAGTGVIVVEAMKMQNEITSPKKGRIQKVLVSEGAAVRAGEILAIIE
jgi:biotin carboxyl carrier protein